MKNETTKQIDSKTEEDMCPVCRAHPEEVGYKFLSSGTVAMMCCEKCGVVYVPRSIQLAMEEFKKKREETRIITPGMVPVGPGLKS